MWLRMSPGRDRFDKESCQIETVITVTWWAVLSGVQEAHRIYAEVLPCGLHVWQRKGDLTPLWLVGLQLLSLITMQSNPQSPFPNSLITIITFTIPRCLLAGTHSLYADTPWFWFATREWKPGNVCASMLCMTRGHDLLVPTQRHLY